MPGAVERITHDRSAQLSTRRRITGQDNDCKKTPEGLNAHCSHPLPWRSHRNRSWCNRGARGRRAGGVVTASSRQNNTGNSASRKSDDQFAMTESPDGVYHAAKVIWWSDIVLSDVDSTCAIPLLRRHLDLETPFCLICPKAIPGGTSLFIGDDIQFIPDSKEGPTGTTLGQYENHIRTGYWLIVAVAHLNDRRLRGSSLDVVICAFTLNKDDLQFL